MTLTRAVLGLQDDIILDVAFPNRTDEADAVGPNLWEFAPDRIASLTGAKLPECTLETGTGEVLRLVKQIYRREGSDEQLVPILYDEIAGRIVTNDSAEIIRMLDQHAEAPVGSAHGLTLVPDDPAARNDIDALNERIYLAINNGAYKAGFSSDQSVYAQAYEACFERLPFLEALLSDGRAFLTGDAYTEADLRLFPTLYRHDPVYYLHMKLNGAHAGLSASVALALQGLRAG